MGTSRENNLRRVPISKIELQEASLDFQLRWRRRWRDGDGTEGYGIRILCVYIYI